MRKKWSIEDLSRFLLPCFARHQSDIRFSNRFKYRYPVTCTKAVLHVNVERCCHSSKSNIAHSLEVVPDPFAVIRLTNRNISDDIFILMIRRQSRRKTRVILQRADKLQNLRNRYGSSERDFSDFDVNKQYAIFSVITSAHEEERDAFVCVYSRLFCGKSRFTVKQQCLFVENISIIILIFINILKDGMRYRTLRSIFWNCALYAIDTIVIVLTTEATFVTFRSCLRNLRYCIIDWRNWRN